MRSFAVFLVWCSLLAVAADHSIRIDRIRAPSNDSFAHRKQLFGNRILDRAFNTFATSESGEPEHTGNPAERSLWWTWKTHRDGTLFLNVDRFGGLPHLIAVYTNHALDQLQQVGLGFGNLALTVQANTAYQIAIDGSPLGESTNKIVLHLSFRHSPQNDDFAHHRLLRGTNVHVIGSVVGATLEPNEPRPYCDSGHTVWWKWVAPEDGRYTFAAVSTNMNPLLSLYRGELTENALIDLPMTGNGFSQINIPAVAGDVLAIAVDGRIQTPQDRFQLTIRRTPPPVNDKFADRIPLVNGRGIGTTEAGSYEPGEGDETDYRSSSVWWQFTPETNGWYTIQARLAVTNAVPALILFDNLNLYTGSTLETLQGVPAYGEPDDILDYPSFYLSAGTNYAIQVNEALNRLGEVRVRAEYHASPANDNFANAATISALPVEILALTAWATMEPEEPFNDFDGLSVWWKWVAPTSGVYSLTMDFQIGGAYYVFSGDMLATLTPITSTASSTQVSFEAMEGTTYHIAARTVFPGFIVWFRLAPAPG